MKVRGPLITLAAVAALGAGILIVDISKETEPAPARPVAEAPASTAAAPVPPPSAPKPPSFPAKADYVGEISTATGILTLEITVEGDSAVAYACDGNYVESWLRGPAVNGAVNMASKDKASRLDGHLDGDAVVGSLSIGAKKWEFIAPIAQPPGTANPVQGGSDV